MWLLCRVVSDIWSRVRRSQVVGLVVALVVATAIIVALVVTWPSKDDGGAGRYTESLPSSSALATSPTPSPPVMPEAAKQNTVDGAKAFVYYFFDVLNYSNMIVDPAPLQELYSQDCEACKAISQTIADSNKNNERLYKGKYAIKETELAATGVQNDYVGPVVYDRQEAGIINKNGEIVGKNSAPKTNQRANIGVRWVNSQFAVEYIGT